MKKNIWVGIYAASLLLFALTPLPGIVVYLLLSERVFELYGPLLIGLLIVGALLALQFLIVYPIYYFKMLLRMWGSIQDGVTPVSRGKAVGFLFIPVFGIYWLFVAWGSFPKHYNAYIDRYKLNAQHLSGGVYVAFPVLLLAAIFVLPVIALPIVFAFLIARTCDAVNQLNQAVDDRRSNVQRLARQLPAPKTKLVFATLGSLTVVSFLFLTAFSVFAYKNLNPKPSGLETPETVGKFKRKSSYVRGSLFGFRKEFRASYELSDGSKKDAKIDYELEEYWREANAISQFKNWSYCSDKATKVEGQIKDKSGKQVGDFMICDGKRFYSRTENRYISLNDSYSSKSLFNSDDFIQFFLNLPFNTQIDAASFSAAPKKTAASSMPSLSTTEIGNRSLPVTSTDKADFVLTVEEFDKESSGANRTENKDKCAGKIVEISGRVFKVNFGAPGNVALSGDENSVFLETAVESREM